MAEKAKATAKKPKIHFKVMDTPPGQTKEDMMREARAMSGDDDVQIFDANENPEQLKEMLEAMGMSMEDLEDMAANGGKKQGLFGKLREKMLS